MLQAAAKATPAGFHSGATGRALSGPAALLIVAALLPGACGPEVEAISPQARPVRTVTVERSQSGVTKTLTGRIEAQDEVALAFRIAGRIS